MRPNPSRHLAWFLGPKGENSAFFESLIQTIASDYIHWRRNYFPGDRILVSRKKHRELEEEFDRISQKTNELMAQLRRSLPFYNPRYLAHMLSDTLLTSQLGFFAGLLYNTNNVVPESGLVTLDMEIQASHKILKMLGYLPPPTIPNEENYEDYVKKVRSGYSWGHITSGGTLANIESLWVARNIRYFPLAVLDIAKQLKFNFVLKQNNGKEKPISAFTFSEILRLRPNEAIFLLEKFHDAVEAHFFTKGSSAHEVNKKTWELLDSSRYSLKKGLFVLNKYKPAIFIAGSSHYSVMKALNLLGLGEDAAYHVKLDSSFRMDVTDLEKQINRAVQAKRIPLAVICSVGSVEEGTIDPVSKIVALRTKLEEQNKTSFWIHVDAAWGGFCRSLYHFEEREKFVEIATRLANKTKFFDISRVHTLDDWHNNLFLSLDFLVRNPNSEEEETLGKKILSFRTKLENHLRVQDYRAYLADLRGLLQLKQINKLIEEKWGGERITAEDFKLSKEDIGDVVREFVSDEITLSYKDYTKTILIKWGSRQFNNDFFAFSQADSITADPHKMGYVNYSCGFVAYKNDRVRDFIHQDCPYVTAVNANDQSFNVRLPPKHLKTMSMEEFSPEVTIDSFGPYILEGSRPGAAAVALWLSIETISPTMSGLGSIIRQSLLSAKELYEWLTHWQSIMDDLKKREMGKLRKNYPELGDNELKLYSTYNIGYEFRHLTPVTPDMNIVVFTIKPKRSQTIEEMNTLTRKVCERFSVQADLDEKKYSYSQSFFLSVTNLLPKRYPYSTLKDFLGGCFPSTDLQVIEREYMRSHEGVVVIRTTIMNPYIYPTKLEAGQNLIREFVVELAGIAEELTSDDNGMGLMGTMLPFD